MERLVNRFLYAIWMFSVAALAIGWQPEAEDLKVSLLTGDVGQKVEAMCILEENNALFRQGIVATSLVQRWENEQRDEEERRKLQQLEEKRKAEEKKKEVQKNVPASALNEGSRQILLRIVEAEAGDQDIRGRRLVANVILNRVKSKEFPDTVKGVVFSPRQFSPVSNGSYYDVKISKATKKAVDQALQGVDDSKGALYFMWRAGADGNNVSWFDQALTKLFTHGCHEFFR